MSSRTWPWAATGPGSAAGRTWSGKTLSLALVRQALPIVCSSWLLFHGCVRHRAGSAGSLLLGDPLSRDPAVPCSSSSTTYFLFLPAHVTSLPQIWVSETGLAQATNHRLLPVGAEELQAEQGENQTRQAVVLSCPHPTAAGSVGWLSRN